MLIEKLDFCCNEIQVWIRYAFGIVRIQETMTILSKSLIGCPQPTAPPPSRLNGGRAAERRCDRRRVRMESCPFPAATAAANAVRRRDLGFTGELVLIYLGTPVIFCTIPLLGLQCMLQGRLRDGFIGHNATNM